MVGHRIPWDAVVDVRIADVAGVAHPIELVDSTGRATRSVGVMEVRIAVPPSPTLHRIVADLTAWRTS